MTAPTKARRTTKAQDVTDEITDTMITSATRTRATKATPAEASAPKKTIVTPEVIEQAKAKRENIDHSACTHPRNAKGRAMCRAARREAATPAA